MKPSMCLNTELFKISGLECHSKRNGKQKKKKQKATKVTRFLDSNHARTEISVNISRESTYIKDGLFHE